MVKVVCGFVRTKPVTQLLLRLGIYQKRQVSCWASRAPDPWSPLLGGRPRRRPGEGLGAKSATPIPLTGGQSRLRDREPRHPAFGEEREFERRASPRLQ